MVQTTTLRIAGMSCGACVRHVTRAIERMNRVVHVDVDFQYLERKVGDRAIAEDILQDAGPESRRHAG